MAASFVILRCGRRTENEGGILELLGDDFTLGRADTCAVQTESDVVSRNHANIQLLDQGWVVADLNSSNGTFLNAKRIETAELRVGDKLMLGEAGPVYEIIALEGSAGGGDLESTRFLRVAKRKQLDDAPQEHAPPPPAPKPTPPPVAPPPPPQPEPLFLDESDSAPLSVEPKSDPEPPPQPIEAPKPKPHKARPFPSEPAAAKRPKRKKPKQPKPKKPAKESARADKPGFFDGFPYGAVAGLIVGVVIGLRWLGDSFPYYNELAAPAYWVWRGLVEIGIKVPPEKGTAMVTITLGLYCALVGFTAQRPVKRFPFLVLLVVAHGAAIYFMRNQ